MAPTVMPLHAGSWTRPKSVGYAHWQHMTNPSHWSVQQFAESFRVVSREFPQFDNYYLDKTKLVTSDSVIYSVGILTDTGFEEQLVESTGATVHMFDPTPITQKYVTKFDNDNRYRFFPVGVWIENATLEFIQPFAQRSASFYYRLRAASRCDLEAECKTLKALMTDLAHEHIDILKMDIEGAALFVLEQMVEQKNFPDQIVVELERS